MDTFRTKVDFRCMEKHYTIYDLSMLDGAKYLPYSLKVLLENLLRHEDGVRVKAEHIEALLDRKKPQNSSGDASDKHIEIAFTPARTLLQDFTGVPAIVDLASLRDAMVDLGLEPQHINPLQPSELVIDHSIQVDKFAAPNAEDLNTKIEFSRNWERYRFLKWGQQAFANFRVVPPCSGIVHQVNLEYLARVVCTTDLNGESVVYPDTLVGTDSHTTMVNGLGVLGWGVGGIEAEAAMLGQPISILLPQVVGFELSGQLNEGVTATDLVLTIVAQLRKYGVVGKFVEFFGDGLRQLTLGDRATIANMAPEYGATCGIFPIDDETIRYLKLTGRTHEEVEKVMAYAKRVEMWNVPERSLTFDETLQLSLSSVVPSLAGPKRPQDRIALDESKALFGKNLALYRPGGIKAKIKARFNGHDSVLEDGIVAIAAITSCTNTSNSSVMMCAGLLAKNAVSLGLKTQPWVKTSLAPGSRVVTQYLQQAGFLEPLQALGFHVVGYGCTTCIGNSGPLDERVSKSIHEGDLLTVAVLSGNRNFEGRIHPEVRMNYLASPPLVVAYALCGTMDIDFHKEPLGRTPDGRDVFLRELWPQFEELRDITEKCVLPENFSKVYEEIFEGNALWKELEAPTGQVFAWPYSTYIVKPPYFDNFSLETPSPSLHMFDARVLVMLGDSVTTDHISPAGSIAKHSPAALYLQKEGVEPIDFNSYGSRRGNHNVMVRGTFANIRLRNKLVDGIEGGMTRHFPSQEILSIYDAGIRYRESNIPLIIMAGKEYGCGSSRDWAAKGTKLLGVRAVFAQSYERIHRSNLVGMGVLPLQFLDGESPAVLGLSGEESYNITLASELSGFAEVETRIHGAKQPVRFRMRVRIDTPMERRYYTHGGILSYVLREMARAKTAS